MNTKGLEPLPFSDEEESQRAVVDIVRPTHKGPKSLKESSPAGEIELQPKKDKLKSEK